jgi:hypothetical protein
MDPRQERITTADADVSGGVPGEDGRVPATPRLAMVTRWPVMTASVSRVTLSAGWYKSRSPSGLEADKQISGIFRGWP